MKNRAIRLRAIGYFILSAILIHFWQTYTAEVENNLISESTINMYKANENLAFAIGLQAYLYGLPLYIMESTMQAMTNGKGTSVEENAPLGTFGHASRLLTPKDTTVVAPNNDTIYSSAWIDLAREPYILHTPAIKDRYYSCELIDMWTNIIALISSRTHGEKEGNFLVVGPTWQGDVPPKLEKIVSSTNFVWILVRILIQSEADIINVTKQQHEYTLTPLSNYLHKELPRATAEKATIQHPTLDNIPENLLFFDRIRHYLKSTPPRDDEQCITSWLGYIGITDGLNLATMDPFTAVGLSRVKTAAEEIMKTFSKKNGRKINGWSIPIIPEDFGKNYLLRATIAWKGLAALPAKEALYPTAYTDISGKKLKGNNLYILHFDQDQLPPVNAFWSITMYDQKTANLVENSIKRYSIGDRTQGILYNKDGSLDIYIQHKKPSKNRASNWLPAPEGRFYVTLRMYNPKEEALDGRWKIPGIYKSLVK